MRFGVQINVTADPIDDLIGLVQDAERVGYDAVFLAEGLSLNGRTRHDTLAVLAILARETERVQLGTSVTNFVLRHPLITAQAFATIHAVSGGRAILGLGRGDTPVSAVGARPTRLAEMEAALGHMRAFLDGTPFTIGDLELESTLSHPDLPILLAADGPKALALAGRATDGVIIGSGLTDEVIEWSLVQVRDARPATADGDFTVWMNGQVQFGSDAADARRKLGDRILPRVNHNLEGNPRFVPDEEWEGIERFRANYQNRDRSVEAQERNLSLVTDYLYKRFSLTGTVDYCAERIRAIRDAGADGFIMATQRRDRAMRREQIVQFGEEIIPQFR